MLRGASVADARWHRSQDRPARVLVVDDEASIRELLSKTLSLAEYNVDTAADGTSALTRLRDTAAVRPAHRRPEDARDGRADADPPDRSR